ncbi:N/A [soil metagenome]
MQRITTKLLQPVEWQSDARCAEVDPEIFFPERGGSSKSARSVCALCSVRLECLEYALNNKEQFGIWGGTSERERRRLRKDRALRRLRAVS